MSLLQSLKLDPKTLRSDLVSGFASGLFSIPEGMAYAQLAGVEPNVLEILKKTGFSDLVGEENIFMAEPGYGALLDAAWEAASDWLETSQKAVESTAENPAT